MSEADDVRRFGDVRTETRYERTVQIEASGVARYRVGVTGLLTAEDGPQSALADGVAREVIADETRTLRFTGEFTEFSIRGDATVRVDGEPFDVEAFPHNTLEIDPNGTVTYDVSASGAVSLDEGAADQPNARTATARTSSTHDLSYAGELTHIEVDGDATIRRNGSRVDAGDVLPSTTPHEFTADARSSAGLYSIDVTGSVETQNEVSIATDSAPGFRGRTVSRYGGKLSAVEHPSGARVEIDHERNEVVTSAPADEGAAVSVETTKGLVVDHEAYDVAEFSLSAGETTTAVPFGDVVSIEIDDLEVELSRDAYPEASESAALQAAAKVERTDEFQRLATIAAGRVRHDAAGIAGEEVLSGSTTTVRSVEHELANVKRADSGVVSVRQTHGRVEHASARYKRFHDDEVTVDAVMLPVGPETNKLQRERKTMAVSSSESAAETTDVEYTAELFANTANPSQDVAAADLGDLSEQVTEQDVQMQGFFSFLNDVRDLLSDIGADVYDTAKFLYDVFKGQLDKVAVTGQNLVISSPYLISSLAESLPSANLSAGAKLAWRVNIVPAVGLASLASADFFEALDTGGWCAGCVFLAIVIRDVLASESASYACFYFAAALPAAVACAVAMEVIIQFGSQYFGYSDVKDELCDGDVVSEIDPC